MPSLIFLSNFLSPHQKPICDQFFKICNGNFFFIATTPINEERLNMGYVDLNNTNYVIKSYEKDDDEIIRLVNKADYVISGSSPDKYIIQRVKSNKLTFKYQERLLKKKLSLSKLPRFVLGTWLHHGRFCNKELYLLCASAFTSSDMLKLGFYKNKCFKWGYFPKFIKYASIGEIISQKERNSLLWVGRFIDWKHPEMFIEVCNLLKRNNIKFTANMIGSGYMENELRLLINQYGLNEYIHILGSMPSEQVRKYMEKTQTFILTSDRQEGWGAVINEAMNSGCSVVAGSLCGAVPFLIENKHNGLIFADGNLDELYESIIYSFKNSERIGEKAYSTISNLWNEQITAERFFVLCKALVRKTRTPFLCGPCSEAISIKDGWFGGDE